MVHDSCSIPPPPSQRPKTQETSRTEKTLEVSEDETGHKFLIDISTPKSSFFLFFFKKKTNNPF